MWGSLPSISTLSGSSDKEDETEEDDEDEEDDIDEEELIKQMLAKEELKLSQQNNSEDEGEDAADHADHEDDDKHKEASSVVSDSDNFSEPSNLIRSSVINVTASTATATFTATTSNKAPSTEASSYPVSSNGRCPYCDSSDVKYIIMVSENTKDTDLPQSLQQLLKRNQAFKMAKGEVEWVSTNSKTWKIYFLLLYNQCSPFQVVASKKYHQ